MMKLNLKKVMIVVTIFALICCVSTLSNASGTPNVNDILGGNDIQSIPSLPDGDGNNTAQPQNTAPTSSTPANLTPLNTNIGNKTTNTALPKTGVDDTMMWVLIGVSAIAAIYTYKKIRDYNM